MTPGFPRMSAPKAAMAASFIAPDQALDFSVPTILETEDDDNEVVDNPEVSYDILPARLCTYTFLVQPARKIALNYRVKCRAQPVSRLARSLSFCFL